VSVVVIHVDVVIVFSEVCEGLLTGTAENKNDKKKRNLINICKAT